jgi:hypothetical protein
MAAKESSQGAALGPDFSKRGCRAAPGKPDAPELENVLGEFMEALCVIDVVSRTLSDLSANASEGVGSCALVLKRGYQMLDTVYRRFDDSLIDYDGSGTGRSDKPADNNRPAWTARHDKKRSRGKARRPAKRKPVARVT